MSDPMMQPGMDLSLWTAREAAQYLRCSVSYVFKAATAGRLPCLHIGRMLRFRPSDIRAFASAGCQNEVLP